MFDWHSAAYARAGEPGAGVIIGAFEQSSGRKYLRYSSSRHEYTKSFVLLYDPVSCKAHTSVYMPCKLASRKQDNSKQTSQKSHNIT